jgi:hypothetical protein
MQTQLHTSVALTPLLSLYLKSVTLFEKSTENSSI